MALIKVEVCYVSKTEQHLIPLNVPFGCTVIRAISESGLLDRYTDLVLLNRVGIFSKKVPLSKVLEEGDRIEIYRPLELSPNEIRLRRAKRLKASEST